MRIGGLVKTSLVDYPGRVACSIFTVGCNFRCGYCHNPELVDPDKYTDSLPEDAVKEFLTARRNQLEGVAISGGEPTLQKDLPKFIKFCKDLGYLVKIDTNGSNPKMLEELIKSKHVDFIAMDIKGPLKKYVSIMSWPVPPVRIKNSIKLIIDSGLPHEFRTTVVKEHLEVKDFEEIGKLVNGANRFALQHFRPIAEMVDTKNYINASTFNEEEFAKAKKIMERYVKKCIIH
jgi:pyruvate formate lyase activating enzyme